VPVYGGLRLAPPQQGNQTEFVMASAKFYCIFPQELISEPIISHTLGEMFEVVPNIRAASIQPTGAKVIVEIEGVDSEIKRSVDYLRERGVDVKAIEDGDEPLV
jgi:hypothetical protein